MIQRRTSRLDGLPLATALGLCAGLLLWIGRDGGPRARAGDVLAAASRPAPFDARRALAGDAAPTTPFGTRSLDELLEGLLDPPILRREIAASEPMAPPARGEDPSGAGPSAESAGTSSWITLRDAEGRVLAEGATVDGLPEGLWHFRGSKGARQASGAFKAGLADGPWQAWHEDGAPRAELGYDAGLPEGLRVEWWPNGVKALEGRYGQGLRSGPWSAWHESGALRSQGSYADGLRHGAWSEWHAAGGVRTQATYVAGRREGHYRAWHENGAVAEDGEFVAGLREGPWGFFSPDGERERRSGVYVAGVRQRD
jgi:antitoxin component YwqK of YwqJK toxin-antitoxin module